MKHSIRSRFTLIFVCLTTFLMLATWSVNNLFLESFYTSDKIRILEEAYQEVDSKVQDAASHGTNLLDAYQATYDPDDEKDGSIQQTFRILGEKYNLTLILLDSSTDKMLLANAGDKQFLAARMQAYIFGKNQPQSDILREHENYTIQKAYDKRSDANYLDSWGYFSDNQTIFLMSLPFASIRESVNISNRFLAYVGMAAIIIGGIFISITTRKITSPILQLADISAKMSNLDFDVKYKGQAEDEIGVLGNSINELSDKLKMTIGQLQSANEELQRDIEVKIQVDEMRKDFIANVSHELKTPIALIQGYAEGLTEGMAEDADSRDYYCGVIMDEANKMNTMVRQLLTLTALEFGNDTPVMEAFDLTDLVRGVIGSAGILIQQNEADVHLVDSGPVLVMADEFKIEEVVTNYLNNALNHASGEKKIVITVEEKGTEALVTVFNTGSHIPEEDLPNLWTKFFKVDKAHTRAYGGSGIGLSIVKAIMESHRQSYGVRNVEGGVEFWFTLAGSDDSAARTDGIA